MSKAGLIKYVSDPKVSDACEEYYCDHAPNRHEQEGEYGSPPVEGVSCVDMNVDHMLGWMKEKAVEAWDKLSSEDKKEVFKASHFQNGVLGFDDEDVDYYFKKNYK